MALGLYCPGLQCPGNSWPVDITKRARSITPEPNTSLIHCKNCAERNPIRIEARVRDPIVWGLLCQ